MQEPIRPTIKRRAKMPAASLAVGAGVGILVGPVGCGVGFIVGPVGIGVGTGVGMDVSL